MKQQVSPAIVGIVIVVVLLAVGLWYFMGSRGHTQGARPSGPQVVGGHKALPSAAGGTGGAEAR